MNWRTALALLLVAIGTRVFSERPIAHDEQGNICTSPMGAQELIAQGLKPAILLAVSGTSKLVPFQNSTCAELPKPPVTSHSTDQLRIHLPLLSGQSFCDNLPRAHRIQPLNRLPIQLQLGRFNQIDQLLLVRRAGNW